MNEMTYIPTVVTLVDPIQLTLQKVSKLDHYKLLIWTCCFGELFGLIVECKFAVMNCSGAVGWSQVRNILGLLGECHECRTRTRIHGRENIGVLSLVLCRVEKRP